MNQSATRTLSEINDGFLSVHDKAIALHKTMIRLRPSLRLAMRPVRLEQLEQAVESLYIDFMSLEADLATHAGKVPADFNSAVRHAAICQSHFGVRDSVRGVLQDTNAGTGSLRARLEALKTLWYAVIATFLSVISIAVTMLSQ